MKSDLLGEGAFGKVYKGFDEQNDRLIAIKELDLEHFNNGDLDVSSLDNFIIKKIKSIELEINILSKLNHKNIVKYLGASRTSEKLLHILLEYCIGILVF